MAADKPKKSAWQRLRARSFAELVQTAQKQPLPAGFIRRIRFPHYRNMEADAALDFRFPISVFTGPNGCGKSSVLHALYGAPADHSVGRYWFSTDVDPIADSPDEKRPSFVYEYISEEGVVQQPIKIRIQKKFPAALLRALNRVGHTDRNKVYDPNYWEPSRPLVWAGLQPRSDGSRDPAVRRDVIYLHFRTQLSAFESAFYGSGPPTTVRREFLRVKSKYLLRAFEQRGALRPRGQRQSKEPVEISGELIQEVNEIVGKNYSGAQAVEHKLFGRDWGESVRFRLPDVSYSDAFAGSGEGAVFRLVRALQKAEEGALVVLDEPEISLHPEAQQRMKHLLLAYAIHKKLQIVLATHSSHFVDGLPQEAVFLFQRGASGRFFAQNVPSELAMVSIGHQLSKRTIVVEDSLAARMVERAIGDEGASRLFDVKALAGVGAAFAALASDASGKLLVLLDGDQRPSPSTVAEAEKLLQQNTVSRVAWDRVISALTNNNVPTFYVSGDGKSGHAVAAEAERVRRQFVAAVCERVRYLPGDGPPEDLLVSAGALEECFAHIGLKDAAAVSTLKPSKDVLTKTAESCRIKCDSVVEMLLAHWTSKHGAGYQDLCQTLRQLIPRKESSK